MEPTQKFFGHGDYSLQINQSEFSPPWGLDRLKQASSANLSWLGEEWKRMKASKFTEAQKAFILKQREQGTPVAESCSTAGISQATLLQAI